MDLSKRQCDGFGGHWNARAQHYVFRLTLNTIGIQSSSKPVIYYVDIDNNLEPILRASVAIDVGRSV